MMSMMVSKKLSQLAGSSRKLCLVAKDFDDDVVKLRTHSLIIIKWSFCLISVICYYFFYCNKIKVQGLIYCHRKDCFYVSSALFRKSCLITRIYNASSWTKEFRLSFTYFELKVTQDDRDKIILYKWNYNNTECIILN